MRENAVQNNSENGHYLRIVYALFTHYNSIYHHGGEISVIWLIERSTIKMLIYHVLRKNKL